MGIRNPRPDGPTDRKCPFKSLPMSEVCKDCALWVHIRGTNPNTGGEVDDWDCSIAWLPMLMIENAQQTRQAGAAVESLRNEISEAKRAAQAERDAVLINGGGRHAIDYNSRR